VSPWLPAVPRWSPLYLARIWHGAAGGLALLAPCSLIPGCLCVGSPGSKGGACAIASATPQGGALDAGEPTQDDPGDS